MSTARVMIVDDDTLLLQGLGRALGGAGYQVTLATSGDDALARLMREPVDVVVSDDRMPGMSGVELLAQVRDRSPKTGRILLSGGASFIRAVRAINDAGVYRFLQKPCDLGELCRCVGEALGRADAGEEPESVRPDEVVRALDEVHVLAQPIVDVRARVTHGYDLIARTVAARFPSEGALRAAAERTLLGIELERRVLQRAGARAAEAPAGARLFVPIHPAAIHDVSLLDPLRPLAGRVILELSERAALDEMDRVADRIAALRREGFRVAVDDLGAGHAGLSWVAALRPDVVKLDGSLVHSIEDSPVHTSLVRALIASCRELGIATVAEGVGTRSVCEALQQLGCVLQQGPLFAHPSSGFPSVAW